MPTRPLHRSLAAAVAATSLFFTLPGAHAQPDERLATQLDTDLAAAFASGVVSADDHDHDHGREDVALLTGLGDPFAEGLLVPADPYVVPESSGEMVRPVPSEPAAWVGPPPDLADIPRGWLRATPAEQVTPSTVAELMRADDGFLGQGLGGAPQSVLAPGVGLRGATSSKTAAGTSPSWAGDSALTQQMAMAAVPSPPSKTLPSTLDAAPGWQYTYSCDPNNKPGIVLFADLVSSHYERPLYYGSRRCLAGDNSQHYEGRAIDWTMNAYDADDLATGNSVAQWLTANNGEMARRFGIMSIIWNRQSWYLYSPSWRSYSGPSPHTDHMHFSFTWDGAMGRTSWWDGTPVVTHDNGTCRVYSGQYAPRYTGRNTSACPTNLPAPPDAPYPVVLPHANNDYVKIAQRYLGFTGTAVDGAFGPKTLSALLSWQSRYAVPVTGVLDKATWARMIAVGSVTRVSGPDRYATAMLLAAGYPTGGEVFITTGMNYPDALAAAARAGSIGVPVLLTKTSTVPTSTVTALNNLKPSRITVVGGSGTVSDDVMRILDEYTTGPVRRLSGSDRYATAGAVAREFGTSVPVVYVATGEDYPDALVAAARSGFYGAPVLLTRPTDVPSGTVSAMQDINPQRVVVVGNTGSVSDAVAQQLASYTATGGLQRVAGNNQYETAAALASYYPSGVGTVYIATGEVFPDALTAAAAAGNAGGPVLLVTSTSLPSTTATALDRLNPGRIVVVGGTSRVSTAVFEELRQYVG